MAQIRFRTGISGRLLFSDDLRLPLSMMAARWAIFKRGCIGRNPSLVGVEIRFSGATSLSFNSNARQRPAPSKLTRTLEWAGRGL